LIHFNGRSVYENYIRRPLGNFKLRTVDDVKYKPIWKKCVSHILIDLAQYRVGVIPSSF
jgi:hypothetical protein